jgi:hypothetical protein
LGSPALAAAYEARPTDFIQDLAVVTDIGLIAW